MRTNIQELSRAKNLTVARGFTLIEIMIVVLIIAVLAGIAMTSYASAMVKTRRGQAKACMQEQAQFLERFYTVNMKYNKSLANADIVVPACESTVTPFYTVSSVVGGTTYTLTAAPTTKQKDTECGTLTLTHTGAKTPTTKGCW